MKHFTHLTADPVSDLDRSLPRATSTLDQELRPN